MWEELNACMGVSKTFAEQMKKHIFFFTSLVFFCLLPCAFESKRNKGQAWPSWFQMFQASDGINLRSN